MQRTLTTAIFLATVGSAAHSLCIAQTNSPQAAVERSQDFRAATVSGTITQRPQSGLNVWTTLTFNSTCEMLRGAI